MLFNTDAPSDIIARFKTNDNSTYIQLVSAGSSWQIGATSDSLDWYNDNNSAVRMSLTETGNLGIGTTSPNALLHLESASSPALQITDTTQPTTLKLYAQDSNTHVANITAHDMVFDTNNTERMRITSGGS